MNNSPISTSYQHQHYNTPSRKPSEHHCNADRKLRQNTQLDQQSLAPLCRILFQESDVSSRQNAPSFNTKLLR